MIDHPQCLHFILTISHVSSYKTGLLKTMLNRDYRLSSTSNLVFDECEQLKRIFKKIKYPGVLIDKIVTNFVNSVVGQSSDQNTQHHEKTVRIILPFIKIRNRRMWSVNNLKTLYCESKPDAVSNQCLVYLFKCDLCDTDYIGYTARHLNQRVEEHKSELSAIGRHMKIGHSLTKPDIKQSFKIIKRCKGKFDCLLYEMPFIRDRLPTLNTQSDSIRSKVFV
ncbi:uncharacterized protein LOC116299330 [Actinia tenebrosa]|uniref:Uncharacterized protein LOC116299330 n=1 Tax=Actinia tenebrosa TaxID=6105 RepID=A0A6P8I5J1_ACTTE|nr:uncharacterized protein LOC116299330 [Actinia tenebrosa]